LLVADILDYLEKDANKTSKLLNIHTASLDELESILGISRAIAKEIIKRRVEYGVLDTARLATIKGIGQKTIIQAEKVLSLSQSNECADIYGDRRSIAIRANVVRIRVAARIEPHTVPVIFEWPPARQR